MTSIPRPPNAQLSHLGFVVRDLDTMISFYQRVLGLVLTDRGVYSRGGHIAFMSRNPAEHHQVVFATGRAPEMRTTINQISFQVDTLEDLRTYYTILLNEKVEGIEPRNHGNTWSIYFLDPEGNRIELYTPTPWHVEQPFGKRFDLKESSDTIRRQTLEMIQYDPTFCPREEWASGLAEKINNEIRQPK